MYEQEIEEIREIVEKADAASRQPIDLNFIAIPADAWDDLRAVLKDVA